MKFLDLIRFGLKNIGRQKARTALTIFAIMIGATSVVVMLSIVFSAKSLVLRQITDSGVLNQVTVASNTDLSAEDVFNASGGGSESGVKLDDPLVAKLAALDHVTAASPTLGTYQLRQAKVKDSALKAVSFNTVLGVVPGTTTDRKLSAGRNLSSADKQKVLVGNRYLEKLGYKDAAASLVGKTLQFEVKGYMGPGADIPKPVLTGSKQQSDSYWENLQNRVVTLEAEVVGVIEPGPYEDQVQIPMQWARELMVRQSWQQLPQQGFGGTPEYTLQQEDDFDRSGYSAVLVKVDDVDNVEAVATSIKAMNLGAATSKELIDSIFQAFNVLGTILGAIGAISLLVAAIGVINTMVMATLERTREIGVLRACGATRATVRRLFTFEAALLGLWGGVFGVGAGYALAWAAGYFGREQLIQQGIPTDALAIPLWLALSTVGVTTIIGMLAGLYPAFRAARMNPVDALHYE
jgi:ABC-type antimicrobial peptide transport system permease subunit